MKEAAMIRSKNLVLKNNRRIETRTKRNKKKKQFFFDKTLWIKYVFKTNKKKIVIMNQI